MRLWHKKLIPVIPSELLYAQWRDCCALAKTIAEKGTSNNSAVNRVMDYSMNHFFQYGELVHDEMIKRGYKCDFDKFVDPFPHNLLVIDTPNNITQENLFENWHDDRYLRQCYYILEEKFDCGVISEADFQKIHDCCKSLFIKDQLIDAKEITISNQPSSITLSSLAELLKRYEGKPFTITL